MQTLKISLLVSAVLLSISACSTPEQRQAQERQRQAVERAALAQRVASLDARCRGYGFELRTTAFAQCVMKLDQADRQAEFAQRQRQELESRCGIAEAQGWVAPTRTGSFGEGAQNAMAARNACLAGLPPPRSTNIICQRQGPNDVYCFSQ